MDAPIFIMQSLDNEKMGKFKGKVDFKIPNDGKW